MKTAYYTRQFKKDLKLAQRRNKDVNKLKSIMALLLEDRALAEKHKDHSLTGHFADYQECHIEPDWLLIYKTSPLEVCFVRTGTHSDLFG